MYDRLTDDEDKTMGYPSKQSLELVTRLEIDTKEADRIKIKNLNERSEIMVELANMTKAQAEMSTSKIGKNS